MALARMPTAADTVTCGTSPQPRQTSVYYLLAKAVFDDSHEATAEL